MSDGAKAQQQDPPGLTALMDPAPDHGEQSYVGHDRLAGKTAIVTGGDSGSAERSRSPSPARARTFW